MKSLLLVGLLAVGFAPPGAFAHGDGDPAARREPAAVAKENAFGRPGDPRLATRTIRIDMDDSMRYSVDRFTVAQGETVRLLVRNKGSLMHELVLGTPSELAEHAELMRRFPDMEHDEDYQLHVKPGATGKLVWQFTKAGEFRFACLLPGHYESGMVGRVVVREPRGSGVR